MFIKGKNPSRMLSVIIAISMLLFCLCSSVVSPVPVLAENGCVLDNVYTDKAMYSPGNTVTITAVITNPGTSQVSTALNVNVFYLETSQWTHSTNVVVAAGATVLQNITWAAPATDFRGYLVRVDLGDSIYKTTAVDVSSDITRFPRYGYTVDFPAGETAAQSNELIDELARDYHINVVQYYDWMYRHEKNFPDSGTSWEDLFGNTIAQSSIQQRIDRGHANNQKAMAYQMAYMAREGYTDYSVSKEWGLYRNRSYNTSYNESDASTISNLDQLNFPLEGNPFPVLFAMNPANTSWQRHMTDQYKAAVNTLSFDGIQVDQMGNFWGNIGKYDYWGNYVDLGKTFSDFVNQAKAVLTTNNPGRNYITMNAVNGGSPENDSFSSWDVAKNADTDFDFSEIWENSNTYSKLKDYAQWQRRSNGKTMVFAAYMNQYDNEGTVYQAESASNNGLTQGMDGGVTYVTGFETAGDYSSYSITAPEAGTYTLIFRFANGNSTRATKSIYVDGSKIMTAKFDPTRTGLIPASASWSSYSTEAAFTTPKTLYLSAGTHTVKIQHDSSDLGDIRLDSVTLGTFDEDSVRLTNALIASSGAMHVEMGTGLDMANGTSSYSDAVMLGHPYYPKAYKVMRDSLRNAMKSHYNFITAYENLLYDTDITTGDGGLQNFGITGESVSGAGEAGKIYIIPKNKGDNYGILHMINLTAENDTDWRNPTATPAVKSNLEVKYYIPYHKSVQNVYWASPDTNQCISSQITFTTSTDSIGKYISFTVPSLKYWTMVYLKWGTQSEASPYEAESSIKSGVTTNTNHAGYTGAGFVDGFGELYDSVTFDIETATEGYYTLKFRYSNATGSECSRELIVDNYSAGKTTFLNLSSWDTWSIAEKGVYLKPGRHRLVLLRTPAYAGYINLDNLVVESLEESARSLYMNNWNDTVAIWKETVVNPAQSSNGSGPGLYELRYYAGGADNNYNLNNIVNYSMFLRNQTDSQVYTDGSRFRSTGYFDSNGILVNEYKTYNGNTLSPKITRSFAFVPEEKFIVVKYSVQNTTGVSKTYRILDMLHTKNNTANNISGSYNSSNKTITVNMSAAGQYYMAHGTLESSIDYYQAANDTDGNTSSSTCSPWVTFNNNGTLKNNTSVTCQDISTGFVKEVTLASGASTDVYFYIAIAGSSSDLNAAVTTLRARTSSYWFTHTGTHYSDWLNSGTRTSFSDTTLNTAYDRTLVALKQSVVPGQYSSGGNTVYKFAAMPATTNPSAYSYKVWARDSAVSAMAMDASGHISEAEKYWYWLADRQITTDQGGWKKPGTFWTCYWIWDNGSVSFVEPEYDSIGMFLVGAYRHYLKLSGAAKAAFLDNIWPAYRRSAEFVRTNIQTNDLGVADCSIWEEASEYNSFTQALYVAGLDAAQEMAKAKGEQTDADNYNGAAGTIRSAIQRSSMDTVAGLWNESDSSNRYYNRAVNTSGTSRTTVDSSSDVLMTYGVIDMLSRRGYDHYRKITGTLQHDEYGIPRYQGDTFYTGANTWDPGGAEALENEPSWPQMSMWVGMMEIASGYDSLRDNALRRMKWYRDRTNTGYMPVGEAVSNVSLKGCVSTSVEPITGASFIMTALQYLNSFDMRIVPNQYNAGAYSAITVHSDCWDTSNIYDNVADWEQWKYIPYYLDARNDNTAGDSSRDIAKVYIANDATNIYVRLDNVGKTLPGYNEANDKFMVAVYSEDFKHGAGNAATSSLYGVPLGRNAQYMVMRTSDSANYIKYVPNGSGVWQFNKNITAVIAPQWEANSGRIEIVIPKAELSNTGAIADNDWANLVIMIGNNTSDEWSEADAVNIHYRSTGSGSRWIFGNSEE
jgi:GH15 family glucan-1,4-alpha-glucosidase